MAPRLTAALAFALLAAACGETGTPDASPYAAGGGDAERASADAETAAPDAEAGGAPTQAPDGLSQLDQIARTLCETVSAGGSDGFADALPVGAGFASRGADGRVHAAWRTNAAAETRVMRPASMETEARRAVDRAVADFLRHNLRAGDDRTGKTGAFRARDGRFCIVQTETAVVEAFREAVTAVEPASAEN